MATKTKVVFNVQKWADAVRKNIAAEQTKRLVEYAKNEIVRIGDLIQTYNSKNHMDRYGNLLDSLCWGVAYDGKLVDSGFYRNPSASRLSYLHEFFPAEWQEAVYGRGKAEEYIQSYSVQGKGWKVFFAILAPYWGYWESGFKMKGFGGSRFLKFNVMTQMYDEVKKDLKPAEVHLTVTAKIRYTRPQLKKAAKRHSSNPYDKNLSKRFNPKTPF